jgi:hypothetical protein
MAQKRKATPRRLIGIGLDNPDGHTRVTRGENFSLYLGSEETHDRMTEACIKLNEKLRRKGTSLDEVSATELRDLLKNEE